MFTNLSFIKILLILFSLNSTYLVAKPDPYLEKATRRCETILSELGKASGLKSFELPRVEVVEQLPNSSLAIAMYNDEDGPTISIHKYTYQICMEDMGKDSLNGLAFILAHELAHVTKKHLVRQLYFEEEEVTEDEGFSMATASIMRTQRSSLDSIIHIYRGISEKFNIRKNEAEADLYAGFTAYLAGYETKAAGPFFLQRAYEDFSLSTKKGKYVSLEERKEIVIKAGEKLDTLIQIFEMANVLTVAGNYKMATHCYKYINQFYTSPAIINNIGLSLILETMEAVGDDFKYYPPFTINTTFSKEPEISHPDNNAGWGQVGSIIVGKDISWIYPKLEEANRYFKQVQISHPSSYEAYLNESIANFLIAYFKTHDRKYEDLNDFMLYAKSAAHRARRAIVSDQDTIHKALSDTYCMLAIIEDFDLNFEDALKHMSRASSIDSSNFILSLNSKVGYQDWQDENEMTAWQESVESNSKCDSENSPISWNPLRKEYDDINNSWDIKLKIGAIETGDILYQEKALEEGTFKAVVLNFARVDYEHYLIKEFGPGTSKETECEVNIGDDVSHLKSQYGDHPKTLQTNSGSYLNYHQDPRFGDRHNRIKGTIFRTDQSKVISWYLFDCEEMSTIK